ncbi:hypothetical protein IBX73_11145 [candidate division WOR-3 bacterium]|nr:hypothetical protein [candidate division WOR-3 bacterium]
MIGIAQVLLFVIAMGGRPEKPGATARTCIFAYFSYDQATVEYIAEHFELVVAHDNKRKWNPVFRDPGKVKWRRARPLLLVYKDCLTLIGPGNPWGMSGDSTAGGGASVGGYWHFDSLFRGLGYRADTQFLMASDGSRYKDGDHRIQAGSPAQWPYRWVMDFGKEYWTRFYACSSKVQCLRNYATSRYDDTFFDGVFIDNILHFNWLYGIYPQRYRDPDDPARGDRALRDAVHTFLRKTVSEYHNPLTPAGKGRAIMAVGNTNMAWMVEGLWEKYLDLLDGGMEETYFADTALAVQEWVDVIEEIEYCEAMGKICLVHKALQSTAASERYPFSVTWFDTAQMMYGFTSYLMAADSMSYFSFGGDYQHIFWAPVLDIVLGAPAGNRELTSDSLFFRYFEEGLVYCNPTRTSRFITVPDEKYYVISASGDSVARNSLLLAPHHGVIFKRRK